MIIKRNITYILSPPSNAHAYIMSLTLLGTNKSFSRPKSPGFVWSRGRSVIRKTSGSVDENEQKP